ncbi:MAG: iron chelate uptake ABC transporter family permease subunit [Oscillospiraceae bacterium]|jgi:iron complex transport system permease protein|nr:iron chelate uptake ABC transporter family permease subunit [Oscillospiraceae bacterium]
MATESRKPYKARRVTVFVCLALLAPASVALYIYSRTYAKAWRIGARMTPAAFESIMGRAVPALIGMSVAAVLIAIISLLFQTMTQSRILTPSMIGFDSIFVGTQTLLVFAFGAGSRLFTDPYINYLLSAGAMVAISVLMYGFILRRNKNNIIFLLMFGLVLSGILGNGARYLQVIMDTNDFYQVQAATNVTVNNMNTSIIFLALPIMLVVIIAAMSRHRTYDVMSLGPDQARGLGVAYEREVNFNLVIIAVGMSVATALIGSLTFLGLLAVNISRELLKTHKHLPLFIASALLAALTLILGQGAVELLQGAVPVTAIINLVGCSYMFYLILRENRL